MNTTVIKRRSFYINGLWIGIAVFCLMPALVLARDLKASLAFLPKILESPDKGAFVDLVKALDDVYTEGKISIQVSPMPRSLHYVSNGICDFHIPLIRNTLVSEDYLPYRFSTVGYGKVSFIIYSHQKAPITAKMLEEARNSNPFTYKIETVRGLESYFDFPVIPSRNINQSLKKVSIQRVDAFIWAQEEADFTLRELNIKVIHRELYKAFEDIVVLPKGPERS